MVGRGGVESKAVNAHIRGGYCRSAVTSAVMVMVKDTKKLAGEAVSERD